MSYLYSNLKNDVNGRVHAKVGRVVDIRASLNRGVRRAVKIPLKTLVRRHTSPIRLLDEVNDYFLPSDVQSSKIIDLQPVTATRSNRYAWRNVHPEAFDRLRSRGIPVLSVVNNGALRTLRASITGNDTKAILSELDTITDGGTWATIGTASGLETDSQTYLYGNGSVKFDLGAGTQDGISTTLTTQHDISKYVDDGSVYLSASFPSTSGLTGVTVRIGSSSGNYNQISVTTDISGNALTTGFNMLKLDFANGTLTGTPDYTAIDYIALLVDKNTTTYSGVRFDRVLVGTGSQHQMDYYSRFGWRTSAGTWKADSTLDTDILNAEEEEYDLIVESCVEQVALDARENKDADRAALMLMEMKKEYLAANPDRSLVLSSDTWLASSIKR